ncbi:hypothetical protein OJF2_59380 [Aquisphaera giovannonii]|uniref:DUF1444 family protein n=1 Tax=Aquisphaera giovannonii TaxID=406548 RepID=A0A5B9W9N6_9BACT|nr:hypothetical protein [Aquisphaera giovannonii]QEH37348.1 hypothetical protein OJF2_59380 [Aquisphaera giovannonii]
MDIVDRLLGSYRRRQFARLITAGLRKAGEPLEFRYDAREFRLVSSGDTGYLINLGNTYREYLAVPRAERPLVLSRFLRSWIEGRKGIPEDFADASHDLLPGVRNRSSFEIMKMQARAEGGTEFDWPYRVVGEHYGAGLVYDLPHAMSQINGQQLERWGVELEEALELAVGNLEQISGQGLQPLGPGVWRSPWRDNYDASRILLPGMLEAHDVEGDPVVMIPNRDTLLLTGSDDQDGQMIMAATAAEALRRPRPLHAMPLRLRYGTWTPYLPPEDFASHQPIRQMLIGIMSRDYGDQKELLQAVHQADGTGVFVAGHALMQERRTGKVVSYCMWARGLDSLLPRTDVVHFADPGRPEGETLVASATWDQVMEIVGDRVEPADVYPERFLVRSFPGPDELDRLREAFGPP